MNNADTTLGKLCEFIKIELRGLYPGYEISALTDIIISQLTGIPKHEIRSDKERPVSQTALIAVTDVVKELKTGKPLQYIMGNTEFFGLKMRVSPDVLIPRPETEEIVRWIIDDHGNESLNIIDIGTGSGCIAVALKKLIPGSTVFACDISLPALDIARENARAHGASIIFFQYDITISEKDGSPGSPVNDNFRITGIKSPGSHISSEDFDPGMQKYDIIVSNPPYIPLSEKPFINRNVRDFEPSDALFVPDDDPLKFYRHIAIFGTGHLNTNGQIYVEIHEKSGQAVKEIFAGSGFRNIIIRRDINGKDRMIKCFRRF